MARGWIHTVHRNGAWQNMAEGEGVLSTHRTKDDAVVAGRDEARRRRTEHLIDNMDGTIAERKSYGSDEFPPRRLRSCVVETGVSTTTATPGR